MAVFVACEDNGEWNSVNLISFFLPHTARYDKQERLEAVAARSKKEEETVDMEVVSRLLRSPFLTKPLEKAVRALQERSLRPTTAGDFTSLRDALITTLLITSMRRRMEFAEFRLGEFRRRRPYTSEGGEQFFLVRILRHKTAQKGTLTAVVSNLNFIQIPFSV